MPPFTEYEIVAQSKLTSYSRVTCRMKFAFCGSFQLLSSWCTWGDRVVTDQMKPQS